MRHQMLRCGSLHILFCESRIDALDFRVCDASVALFVSALPTYLSVMVKQVLKKGLKLFVPIFNADELNFRSIRNIFIIV